MLEKFNISQRQPIIGVEEIIPSTPGVLTVAIAGCSSSGKTTLALLLSEIFSSLSTKRGSTDDDSPLDLEKENLDGSQTTIPSTTPFTTTIHQDDFFIQKALCPFVAFNSTNNDKKFIKDSLNGMDEKDIYSYFCTGAEEKGNVRIIGPNTDCMEAVDFGELLRRVQAAKINGSDPEKNAKSKKHADKRKLVERYSGVIAAMRKRVEERLASTSVDYINGWVFVEGFLLLSKSMPSDDRSLAFDELEEGICAEIKRQRQLQPKVDEELMREMERIREERAPSNEALMQEFDVKLFLPTSKEVARHRRLSRFPYVDSPAGGRLPGQMWKSEGYFEEVVWKGYENSFDWLLKDTGKGNVNGVFVRSTLDDTVENTVEWAIDIILEALIARGEN
ncbi:hypothetical protein DSL72_008148 [Monilinia vaccinii-corymbosi]|uniref:Phosphoribulokinase/uridine kinase domain-containing protein n=1 Tax=Monilinia vaccinii-corymbosi TaxID=61207 RepID=A0A8A3PJV6_9HELO|nr:hypothetical protein DSL72_008148 [Monilinia vaccinii-corymbosi]